MLVLKAGEGSHLTKPLEPEGQTSCHYGLFKHSDLLGRRAGDVVRTHRGLDVRARLPTLAEYTSMTPRIVTPVSSH